MAWIESHSELGRHPKTRKLARLLGVEAPTAVGYLHFLWWWALDFAPDGDISRFAYFDIADACLFVSDENLFVDALVQSGYLDRGEDGKLTIHDWADYGGKLTARREKDRNRKRDRQHNSNGIPTESNGIPTDSNGIRDIEERTGEDIRGHNITGDYREKKVRQEKESKTSQGGWGVSPCPAPISEIVEIYEKICVSRSKVRKITPWRRDALAKCWSEYPSIDTFRRLFEALERLPFLNGQNRRGWMATFDWVIDVEHMTRILEGAYDDVGEDEKKSGPKLGDAEWAAINAIMGGQ